MKPKIIVSACLAGFHCRFDCAAKEREQIKAMVESGEAIPVCPEQMGGLSTPRPPSEIIGDKVMSNQGIDVTVEFKRGAEEALLMAQMMNAKEAYLKSKSPMCGSDKIYDGTFKGILVDGDGMFTRRLKEIGIKVHSID